MRKLEGSLGFAARCCFKTKENKNAQRHCIDIPSTFILVNSVDNKMNLVRKKCPVLWNAAKTHAVQMEDNP